MAANDMLVPYLKQILDFIGITDIETIRAEAQSFGLEASDKGAAAAMDQVAAVGKTVRAGVRA
jgi:FMN-dependent NADH-azoreductase